VIRLLQGMQAPLPEPGGEREQGSNTTLTGRGAAYALRRLKRDRRPRTAQVSKIATVRSSWASYIGKVP
jgi:hypothetical protein